MLILPYKSGIRNSISNLRYIVMSGNSKKTKSPRYPTIDLKEALEKAQLLYESNHLHPVDNDAAAQSMNYSGANNGSALSAMAALRYFGLIERTGDGKLSVVKDVENYIYAPSDDQKRQYLIKWLKSPPVFSTLIEQYGNHLPSDAAIRYELIQMGFLPSPANNCIQSFKQSLEFATQGSKLPVIDETNLTPHETSKIIDTSIAPPPTPPSNEEMFAAASITSAQSRILADGTVTNQSTASSQSTDRIPIRLRGGRKAWVEIPMPFYDEDRKQIKAQLDLLLTDDQEG